MESRLHLLEEHPTLQGPRGTAASSRDEHRRPFEGSSSHHRGQDRETALEEKDFAEKINDLERKVRELKEECLAQVKDTSKTEAERAAKDLKKELELLKLRSTQHDACSESM